MLRVVVAEPRPAAVRVAHPPRRRLRRLLARAARAPRRRHRRRPPLHDAPRAAAPEHDAGARSGTCSPTSRASATHDRAPSSARSAACPSRCCSSAAPTASAARRGTRRRRSPADAPARAPIPSASPSSRPRAGSPTRSTTSLQKLARALGTNHVDNGARLCHAASTTALKQSLGVAAATCSLKDWIGTDLLVIWGSDLANNQPVTTKYLHYAKQAGTRIVVVNPFREPGLERYWVPSVRAQRALRHARSWTTSSRSRSAATSPS